jgi:hypothetical protein
MTIKWPSLIEKKTGKISEENCSVGLTFELAEILKKNFGFKLHV